VETLDSRVPDALASISAHSLFVTPRLNSLLPRSRDSHLTSSQCSHVSFVLRTPPQSTTQRQKEGSASCFECRTIYCHIGVSAFQIETIDDVIWLWAHATLSPWLASVSACLCAITLYLLRVYRQWRLNEGYCHSISFRSLQDSSTAP
jgi:hypothetical protein